MKELVISNSEVTSPLKVSNSERTSEVTSPLKVSNSERNVSYLRFGFIHETSAVKQTQCSGFH